ncbi:RagB/SusD family nutrient uptake outer membrane protein [Bacteroides fragilis]|nr:RagB/SusD family nutrient uptake outer membrane protein [Bacteroides fragilis]
MYDTDFIVYRYADALLMMAEVKMVLKIHDAAISTKYVNDAYGSDYEANKYTEGNYAENELAILHERDKEFVWEGKRWFDVVHMHDANGKSLAFSATANYPAGTNRVWIQ